MEHKLTGVTYRLEGVKKMIKKMLGLGLPFLIARAVTAQDVVIDESVNLREFFDKNQGISVVMKPGHYSTERIRVWFVTCAVDHTILR